MKQLFHQYIIFWLSQSISQLGSAMTGFALILWAYAQNGTAMTVSLMSFCLYMPYVIVSLFAGSVIDRHSKKKIMLLADSVAAACSAGILLLCLQGDFQIWHIYVANAVLGFVNAFQNPASAVAIGKIVPKEKLAQVSGMNAFSLNLVAVLAPVFSASLYAFCGLKVILLIDLLSFAVAFSVLLLGIRIPESMQKKETRRSLIRESGMGLQYLRSNAGIFWIIITLAVLNFFSRLTYENILSPMILARSGNDGVTLGIVSAVMGIGGIVGGLIVASGKGFKDSVRMIYLSAMFSFLLGDLLMGLGRNVAAWSVAALAASVPIPFITAGQNLILYQQIPQELQGRVFSLRNAVQYSTIPVGILLGGFLADYVFEPFMAAGNPLAMVLRGFVGEGTGSGMAVMFLCTGLMGAMFSFTAYRQKEIQKLRRKQIDSAETEEP